MMFGIESLTGTSNAVAQVGVVLVEALLLYVVYGVLTATVGQRITNTIQGE